MLQIRQARTDAVRRVRHAGLTCPIKHRLIGGRCFSLSICTDQKSNPAYNVIEGGDKNVFRKLYEQVLLRQKS